MSRSRPDVPVREISYSHIARPQLGHAGVLPTGCLDDLSKLDWGTAPLLALPTNPQHGTCSVHRFATNCLNSRWGARVRLRHSRHNIADLGVRFTPKRGHPQSRRVASIDGEIPADNAIVTAASAGGSSESDASTATTSTTVAADLHRPIPAATG